MPTTTLLALRQQIIEKYYASHETIVSTTTSLGTTTALNDTILAPTAQIEDYVTCWVLIASTGQVTSATTINDAGGISASDLTVTVADGTKFIAGDGILLDTEICKVTLVAANVLTITRAIQGTTAATHADGITIYLVGPAVGEVSRVTNVNFGSGSSQLTVSPAFTVNVRINQSYELHYKFTPTQLLRRINEILENLEHQFHIRATLAVDGDMEATDTAAWFPSSGNIVVAKDTTFVLHGRQSLKAASAAINTSITMTTNIYIEPGTTVLVAADVYVQSTAKVIKMELLDITNSNAVLETATTSANGWNTLYFTAQIPATCQEIEVRFTVPLSLTTFYIDGLTLLDVDEHILTLPSTFEWGNDVQEVVYFPRGNEIVLTEGAYTNVNAYRVRATAHKKLCELRKFVDDRAAIQNTVELITDKQITEPIFFTGKIDYARLSAQTDTTLAPADIVCDLVIAALYDIEAAKALDNREYPLYEAKKKEAIDIRNLLTPRMLKFSKPRGVVQGAFR